MKDLTPQKSHLDRNEIASIDEIRTSTQAFEMVFASCL